MRNWSFRFRRKTLLSTIMTIPFMVIERVCKSGAERYMLYQISFIPSVVLRYFLYKGLAVKANNVTFHFRTEIRAPWKLNIGNGTIIGDNALLDARNGLTFGKNVNLSSNVSIYTQQHDYRDSLFRCTDRHKMSVEVDDRAWIGSNVIILPGVHIGEGAVCCAGCVVTKDVELYTVVACIPAKKISTRPQNLDYEFNIFTSCSFY